ncbi:amidase [Aestuariivita boseongensis]|uniref:amidase n=1 Tax=Aestuariivita boseongensis TaxID=1470562 RepID=UPI0006818053|nr:amidase [Aestuariivita boseongensis]
MSDLAYISASDALAAFRAKRLSPVELTDAIIARAERTEPDVNAFTYRYFEDARAAARNAEARYMGHGAAPRLLEGLCVAVKDAGHIAGQPTSAGSLLSDTTPQPATSPINERVLATGAIVHARSATPEFSCAAVTWSKRWGVTRNPWNLDMTPGGSSGGAGAALAVGSTTLSTGSDIGGSIRIPASCCGVVGYKPPRGRNPVDAPFNLDPYCHTGPLARTVADALLFQNCLSGPHPADPCTLPKRQIKPSGQSVRDLKIAVSRDLGFFSVDPEVAAALYLAASQFRDMGAQVSDVELPWTGDVLSAALTHLRLIFGTSIAPENDADWPYMTPYAERFAREGLAVQPRDYVAALSVVGEAGRSLGAIMGNFDLLLCPTTAIPAVKADFDPGSESLQISGRSVDPMLGRVMTAPFNMLGTHPVLSLPMALARNGVPMGLQIVGRPFDEDTVFRAGLAFERARGAWFTGQGPKVKELELSGIELKSRVLPVAG